ncbi:hypothetical protein LEMLEM_LOCUS27762 [Lemmus lemmus]
MSHLASPSLNISLCIYVCVGGGKGCVCHNTCVAVRGQLCGAGFLFPPLHGFQESHRSASPAIFETTGQINFFRCFLKPTIQATNGLRGVLCMSAHQKTAWHPHEIIVTDSYEPPCGC